ncbi:DUF4129 domain-containing protein [Allobranchiibius sp. CTAmp26]|uniref:DUF4129 domain-containing protein n=1 Tax=Allobranchiibius sp. CTAmp26 TaxID=2815214 RepID=UPI001AA13465|nr:DUF4129 domain-containing protein [Allobranchiibius sp. CTAmp26]MBO1756014.1 DUF4129 domain-containing protein [Allobranchiibius sp. CTAmp26]
MVSGGRATNLQRRVLLIAVGAAVLVISLLAATTRRPAIVHSSARTPVPPSATPLPTPATTSRSSAPTGQRLPGNAGLTLLAVLGVLLVVLFLVLVIAGLVLAADPIAAALQRRRELRARRGEGRPVVGSASSEVLTESLPDLLRAVQEGSPRAGIIAAWVRLEGIAADAGVAPRRSETSAELTIRVLDEMAVPGRWILRLADLYREARFSDHPMTEADRAEATRCLSALAPQRDDPTREGVLR